MQAFALTTKTEIRCSWNTYMTALLRLLACHSLPSQLDNVTSL